MRTISAFLILLFVCAACASAQEGDLTKLWKAGPPAYKVDPAEQTPSVKITKDSLTLKNRGIAISTGKYTKGFELSFTWKWTAGADKGSYQDVLTVGIRTSGKQLKFPAELEDAVIVRFAAHAKKLAVEHRKKGQLSSVHIANIPIECNRDTAYKVKILEKPGEVVIFYNDLTKPALTVTIPVPEGENVTLDNRELGGGNPQVSVLSDVILKGR